jgi:monoamine oxidase
LNPITPNKPHIHILGAGISGLSAASLLKHFVPHTLTVSEGRDRLGGRIYSEKMPNSEITVDLGASWIHGIGKGVGFDKQGRWRNQWNPVYKVALQNQIETARTWKQDADDAKEKTFMKDGSDKVNKKLWTMLKTVYEWVDNEKNNQCEPNKDLKEVIINKVLRQQITCNEDIEIAEYVMRYLYCMSYGAETSKISAKYLE